MVEWATVTGANHASMGHPASAATQRLVGSPYLGFDSSAAIWSFLAATAALSASGRRQTRAVICLPTHTKESDPWMPPSPGGATPASPP